MTYAMPAFFTVVPPVDIHIRNPEEVKKKFKPKRLHHLRGHDGEKEASCHERKRGNIAELLTQGHYLAVITFYQMMSGT